MGKAIKSVGDIFGLNGGGGAPPVLNRKEFDITKQAKEYEDRLKQQAAFTNTQNQSLSEALAQQARGEGPLAGAAMRQASNRSLAQTLSAAQAMGGSPLAMRNILQARGQANRDLAELGQQEQLKSQEMLGQQLDRAANTGRADATAGFGIARAPQDMMADYEKQRFAADVARRNAIEQSQRELAGSLIGSAAKAGMAYATGGASAVPGVLSKAHGGIVPGKPAQQDSVANDTVPAVVSPGEMIVPASVVAKGPKEIKTFAEALLKAHNSAATPGYASIAAMKKGKKNV